MASQSQNEIPVGMLDSHTTWGPYNNLMFSVRQMLEKVQTAALVKVISCTNAGQVSPVGFVDVLPLVNAVDGSGNSVPHTDVHNLPYLRIQGGSNAVIIDPQPGDIGICVFASRDISKVKATKAQANPGSWRSFDMADGLYLGGVLNQAPVQYIEFYSGGIAVKSPTAIDLNAPSITMEASTVTITASSSITLSAPIVTIDGQLAQGTGANGGSAHMLGPLTVDNDVTASGTSTHHHQHDDPQGGTTSEPI